MTAHPDREAERIRRERKDALLSYVARHVAKDALRRAHEERIAAEREIAASAARQQRAAARAFAVSLLVMIAAGAAVALLGVLA
jgi:hypothetical protein